MTRISNFIHQSFQKIMADGLSERLLQLNIDGNKLNVDSQSSEKRLNEAVAQLLNYCKKTYPDLQFCHESKITLYDIKSYAGFDFHKKKEDKKISMRPDGGIFYLVKSNSERIPILIVEDKIQGTNDLKFKKGQRKDACGNAIERAAKNMKASEMLFFKSKCFPYVIFASGCDFHHTESITSRLTMMNWGFSPHYIEIKPEKENDIDKILPEINVTKKKIGENELSIASIFVKAHKYDVMEHGSSFWTTEEYYSIIKTIVNQVISLINE